MPPLDWLAWKNINLCHTDHEWSLKRNFFFKFKKVLVDTLKQLTCLLSQIACNLQNSIGTFFAKSSFHNFFNLFIVTTSTEVQLSTDYRVAESLSSGIKPSLHKSYVTGLDLWKFINKKSFHNMFVILPCYDENFYYEIKGEIKFVTKFHQKTKRPNIYSALPKRKTN